MSKASKERITVRLNATDMNGLKKIQSSGDLEDISTTIRWCIHFSVFLLKIIPAAIIESFVITEATEENDTLEDITKEVSDQK